MEAATLASALETDSSWRVSRDGTPVAVVELRREGGDVVVATELGETARASASVNPSRFATLQAADEFVSDLIASFSYLGCDVVRS